VDEVWDHRSFDRRTRRLIALAAPRRFDDRAGHVRAAHRNRMSEDEIKGRFCPTA
jgi:alkylhydroperoxidase/carboxymuconolactone decarboxylase family protein YurZ